MKKSTEQKNAELMLETVRRETQEAAEILAIVLKNKNQGESELAELKAEGLRENERIADERNKLQSRTSDIEMQEREHETNRSQRKHEIGILEEKIRDANKLLQRIQGFIFGANAEYDKLQGDLRDINKEIADKGKLVEGVLSLKDEYAQEEKRRDSIRIENDLSVENAKAAVREAKADQADAEKRRDEALADKDEAESEGKRMRMEHVKINADLGVLSGRIHRRYKEAFPALHRE